MPSLATLGIDVGGTKIRAGVVSSTGKVTHTAEIPTMTSEGKEAVLANILEITQSVAKKAGKLGAIGVGMAGLVDHKKGVFRKGPNFPKDFADVSIGALLRKTYGVPVQVDNDVHCFTLAEAKFGAAKRFSTVVGITLGTGIGGGIVCDGQIFRGRNNAAGEFGHTMLQIDSDARCGCGKHGHFEALASGSAINRLYHAHTGRDIEPIQVERLAAKGDDVARGVLDTVSQALAEGIASVIHSINPDIVVVGGGLAKSNAVWQPMFAMLKSRLIFPALADTPVVRGSLGPDAAVIGAALITKTH